MYRLYSHCTDLLRIAVIELFHDRHIQFRVLRGEMMRTRHFGLGRVFVCTIGRRVGCLVSWHVKPVSSFAQAWEQRVDESRVPNGGFFNGIDERRTGGEDLETFKVEVKFSVGAKNQELRVSLSVEIGDIIQSTANR